MLPTLVAILVGPPLLLVLPENQKNIALPICIGLWILIFTFALWILPKHLIIQKDGITIRRRGRDEHYSYEQVKGIRIKQDHDEDRPTRLMLKVKLERIWYSFEIDYGRVRYVYEYLPKHLTEKVDPA
ncbi:hypothetical protein [Pelagicoccus albus]|uniref:Uncharacterized protein n=1 Tax=Pelagicoccus albus TaxID=415222 RepID=A0A7X1E750_9BACT|nr:hypothetical protein [Pelagicoccus albus]MBC2604821.1 hypothetical protein [Pelagicoccus albus]